MSDGTFTQRQQELIDLRQDPHVTPAVLQDTAWTVLRSVLYDAESEDGPLLPGARDLLQRIADDETQRRGQTDIYFNARTTIATWGAFTALSRNDAPPDKIRVASRRNLGKLVADTTDKRFDLDALDYPVAQKVTEAITLQLLFRVPRADFFGVPAPPEVQRFKGFDEYMGTTAFHVYGITERGFVPAFVNRLTQDHFYNPDSHRGVLLLSLGSLFMTAGKGIRDVREQSKAQGAIKKGQRWMTNTVASILFRELADPSSVTPAETEWMNKITDHLRGTVLKFDPSKIAVPDI